MGGCSRRSKNMPRNQLDDGDKDDGDRHDEDRDDGDTDDGDRCHKDRDHGAKGDGCPRSTHVCQPKFAPASRMLSVMAQESLRDLWESGQSDRLSPWMCAMALAYREASKEISKKGKPNIAWVATKVTRVDGENPTPTSLHDFFKKVDADPDWFPGKHAGTKRGPKPLFTPAKRRAVAQCAMRIKERGDEPTPEEVVQRCPVSTLNTETGKTFDLKLIRKVFSTECYDLDPENPWRHQTRNKRTFLPGNLKQHRFDMCRWHLGWGNFVASWFFHNVVWVDPCSSVLPGSYRQYLKQKQLVKGDKGWVSDNAKQTNPNARGPKTALQQKSWEGRKMNWVIILARGVVGVDILPMDWALDGDGMATVVRRLEERLRDMLGDDVRLPRVLMSDRGTGMYAPAGQVVAAYDHAVRECNFRTFWGPDAKKQSPDMPDLLLHETAVSWLRGVLRRTKPVVAPWLGTPEQWPRRMMTALDEVNRNNDVESLCMQFPDRVDECFAAEGARLSY